MLVMLPAVSLLLIVVAIRLRTNTESWREAFLAGSVALATFTVLATEALSVFRLVVFPAIVCFWTVVTLIGGAFLYVSAKTPHARPRLAGEDLTIFSRVLLACVVLYVLTIALIAILSPPNTGDSFEYHMPRVAQWVQNHSIAFFPTAVPRQNHLAPGAEYAILHLQVLSGSDRFANFVEWMSMVGSPVAISLIAREFGAKTKGQLLSVIFALTLPMGIMQASSTQTDYVIAFWFVCFVHYLLRLRRTEVHRLWLVFLIAASLGLAVLSKATAYLLASSFLVWLTLSLLKRTRREVLRAFTVLTIVFLCMNAGHYLRNWQLYRTPLGPGHEPAPNTRYSMEIHSPRAVISNLSKNVATHLGTPWPKANAVIANFYVRFHNKLGIDVNDTRISWGTGSVNRFGIRGLNHMDEIDGNPLHFLLAVLAAVLLLLSSTLRNNELLLKYAAALAAAATLWVVYLKWSPWMSRLHVPLFILVAPLVGVVLTRPRHGRLANVLSPLLLLLGVPWLLYCQQRPMVGQENIFNTPRDRLYMHTRRLRNVEPSFLNGKAILESRNASNIGLMVSNSSIEYWWWEALLRDNRSARLQHVNVQEPSGRISAQKPFCDFRADAILALDQKPLSQITVNRVVYLKQWEQGRAAIYFPMQAQ